VLGQILVIVVVIVVSVVSFGALTAPAVGWGAAAAGAVAGAAASVAGQIVGMATGVQDKFSFKDVALGALGGAVGGVVSAGGAIGSAVKGSAAVQGVVRGAIGSALTQGIAVVTGLQDKFSWKEVAISAASGAASGSVSNKLSNASRTVSDTATTLTSSAVRAALGGKVEIANVMADVFGNAIGNSLAAGRQARISTPAANEQAMDDGNGVSAPSPLAGGGVARGPVNRPSDGIEEIIVTPPTSGAVEINWGAIFSGSRTEQRESFARASAGLRDAGAYDALGALHGAQLGYRRGLDALEQQQRIADYIAAGEAIYARSDRGAPRIVDEAALIGRERGPHMTLGDFGRGVGNALFQVVYQPLAMAYDLEQVAWEAGRSLITGEAPRNIYYASALGEAASGGAGTGEILWSGVKGAIETPGRLIDAVQAGDGYGAGNELTNLAMMVYGGKVPKLSGAVGAGRTAMQALETTVNNEMRATVLANLKASAAASRSSQIDAFLAKSAQIEGRVAAEAARSESAILSGIKRQAIARYASEGLTDAQEAALINNPGLRGAFRGDRIDAIFKELVETDPRLQHLVVTPRAKFGPDVFNPMSHQWWDVTTPADWAKHVRKYTDFFGEGSPLYTQ
jgi:hypothetical protein